MKCCICKKEIKGYGNNPYPYKRTGSCCKNCNLTKVLSARIGLIKVKRC